MMAIFLFVMTILSTYVVAALCSAMYKQPSVNMLASIVRALTTIGLILIVSLTLSSFVLFFLLIGQNIAVS